LGKAIAISGRRGSYMKGHSWGFTMYCEIKPSGEQADASEGLNLEIF